MQLHSSTQTNNVTVQEHLLQHVHSKDTYVIITIRVTNDVNKRAFLEYSHFKCNNCISKMIILL